MFKSIIAALALTISTAVFGQSVFTVYDGNGAYLGDTDFGTVNRSSVYVLQEDDLYYRLDSVTRHHLISSMKNCFYVEVFHFISNKYKFVWVAKMRPVKP